MFELLDVEYLLEEVVQLFLAHHLVPHQGRGQSLAWPPRLVLCNHQSSLSNFVATQQLVFPVPISRERGFWDSLN